MNPDSVAVFNQSPYNGVAIPIVSAYYEGVTPEYKDLLAGATQIRGNTQKDIWPWVYLNRIIGKAPSDSGSDLSSMDLSGGNREESFLQLWRTAFRLARETKSAGVVGDLEAYSDHSLYSVPTLAARSGKSPDEVIRSLEDLGAQMADVANEEFPGSTIWFLFTAAGKPHPQPDSRHAAVTYRNSTGYILLGMLDRIVERELRLSVISGGESSLGYCHQDLQHLRTDIQFRAERYSELADQFPQLSLGGTMTLWRDRAAKSDWLNRGSCASATAEAVEDLEPYLELLLHSYKYVWIYVASGIGGYNPFDASTTSRFNRVIQKAKTVIR